MSGPYSLQFDSLTAREFRTYLVAPELIKAAELVLTHHAGYQDMTEEAAAAMRRLHQLVRGGSC